MNWTAIVDLLDKSALFTDGYATWESTHVGQTKATFAAGLLLPLTNVGRGVAPPFENMHPAVVARWCLVMLCASSLAVDREI